jgi:glutaminyl-tRNA synthetase
MRLAPGKEVRLKNAYIIKCDEEHPFDADADGRITTIYCTYDPDTRSGQPGANRKIKGKTLHWVPVNDCIPFEARLYEPLLNDDVADEEEEEVDKKDFISRLNPDSLEVKQGYAERFLAGAEVGTSYQFLRTGYFCKDPDSTPEKPVFNRTVGLRDTFAKQNRA